MNYYDYEEFTLPSIDFVGGETQQFLFRMFDKFKRPIEIVGDCNFAITSYTNPSGAPLISKTMSVVYDEETQLNSSVRVDLTPSDTVNLNGKYIYQISIKSGSYVDIPKHGIMYVIRNNNPGFVS